jgi:hypothetical protein
MTTIADVFLNKRADHLSSDRLFSEFIVPPFFQRNSLFSEKGSVRILGGRGCGKTMFIRYFGHGSALNPMRKNVPESEIQTIGLYLRPDTGFCDLMTDHWLGDFQAKLAFSHYVALHLLIDACRAVTSLKKANFMEGSIELEDPTLGQALSRQIGVLDCKVSILEDELKSRLVDLESWVRNPKQSQKPTFISFASIIPRFAEDISTASPRLKDLAFRAFIDEFENLPSSHREVICDAIKHPNERMVVHIAHKKQAVVDFKTSSPERIVEGHDIRTIDLEEELSGSGEFELLAAELFLLRVHQAGVQFNCPQFKPEQLHDARHLSFRLTKDYREQVLGCVRAILPSPSALDIAKDVLTDEPLRRRLRVMLLKGLELQKLDKEVNPDELISETYPQASIVLGALLNRRTQNGKDLIEQFLHATTQKISSKDPFFKSGGWIDNNLHGCLFHLYAGLPRRANINYAGFDRFCMLSKPNLRFFQLFCHTALLLAFKRKSGSEVEGQIQVTKEIQAIAAKQVSDKIYQDIHQLGGSGAQLLEATGRLGRVFEAFNRRRSQSESEVNHLSIDNADIQNLSAESEYLLREAKIWSVLYEENDTKNKTDYDIAQTDLILNPIFSPHFGISYRKRRKVTLKAVQANVLLCQSTELFDAVLKQVIDSSDQDSPKPSEDLFE